MSNNVKWLWLAGLSLVLAACGGDDDNDDSNDDEPNGPAIVKVVPVSANAPLVSLLVDADLEDDVEGTAPAGDQSHGQAASLSTARGTQEYTFRYAVPEGVGRTWKRVPVTETFRFDVAADTRYEFYVGGEYPDGEYWTVQMPRLFEERGSKARVTLVNASPDAPALDFHLTKVGEPVDSASLLSSLEYKAADTSVRVAPGDYELKITEADSMDVVYTSETISLSSGADISLVSIDNAWIKEGVTGKSPIVVSRSSNSTSRLLFDVNAGADVRVVHASLDAGSVDVVLDDDFGAPLAEDLTLGEATERATVEGGIHNIKVVPANGTTVALDADYNLFNGVAWTVFLTRDWENLDPLFVSENMRAIDGQARLRFVFASTGMGTVDVYVTEPGADLASTEENDDGEEVAVYSPAGTDLTLRAVTQPTPVAPDTYSITFTRAGTEGAPVAVYGPVEVTLESGGIYTMLLRDNTEGSTRAHDWLDDVPAEEQSAEDDGADETDAEEADEAA